MDLTNVIIHLMQILKSLNHLREIHELDIPRQWYSAFLGIKYYFSFRKSKKQIVFQKRKWNIFFSSENWFSTHVGNPS